eukprot:916814-Prymnesium_polylepis.1
MNAKQYFGRCAAVKRRRMPSPKIASAAARPEVTACHVEKSISIVRRDAPRHSLDVGRARHSAVRRQQTALPPSRRLLVRLPCKQRDRNERREVRPSFTGPSNLLILRLWAAWQRYGSPL